MKLSALHNLSPLSKLSLFVVLLLVIAIFTTISFSLRQQRLISKAWSTSESAKAQCNEKGEAEIAVQFRNTETNNSLAMNVSAKDVQTGLTVNLGTVSPLTSTTAAIQTHRSQIDASSVIFFLSWTNNASGTDQRGATYARVSCVVTPTAIPTLSPSLTPLPIPTVTENTYFNLDVIFHGIGASGDSANPKGKGNQNPIHKMRTVTVQVLNSKNELVMSKSGDLKFASDSGHFLGTIDMGKTLTTDVYLIKVKGDSYLRAALPGIVSIRAGKTNMLGEFSLVAGDINNDNIINILDYNLLMGCYSDLQQAVDCNSERLRSADLTDDGNVNQFDYNLFLRELTTSVGK